MVKYIINMHNNSMSVFVCESEREREKARKIERVCVWVQLPEQQVPVFFVTIYQTQWGVINLEVKNR